MSVSHFDPYHSEDVPEKAMCGTIGYWEGNTEKDTYYGYGDWSLVTCKKCLKQKQSLTNAVELIEADIIKGMGEFAEFCKDNETLNPTPTTNKKGAVGE